MSKVKLLLGKFMNQIYKTKEKDQEKKNTDLDSIEAVIAKYEELLGR